MAPGEPGWTGYQLSGSVVAIESALALITGNVVTNPALIATIAQTPTVTGMLSFLPGVKGMTGAITAPLPIPPSLSGAGSAGGSFEEQCCPKCGNGKKDAGEDCDPGAGAPDNQCEGTGDALTGATFTLDCDNTCKCPTSTTSTTTTTTSTTTTTTIYCPPKRGRECVESPSQDNGIMGFKEWKYSGGPWPALPCPCDNPNSLNGVGNGVDCWDWESCWWKENHPGDNPALFTANPGGGYTPTDEYKKCCDKRCGNGVVEAPEECDPPGPRLVAAQFNPYPPPDKMPDKEYYCGNDCKNKCKTEQFTSGCVFDETAFADTGFPTFKAFHCDKYDGPDPCPDCEDQPCPCPTLMDQFDALNVLGDPSCESLQNTYSLYNLLGLGIGSALTNPSGSPGLSGSVPNIDTFAVMLGLCCPSEDCAPECYSNFGPIPPPQSPYNPSFTMQIPLNPYFNPTGLQNFFGQQLNGDCFGCPCPPGTIGIYPKCICPPDMGGVPPDCVPCDENDPDPGCPCPPPYQDRTYPDCPQACPPGTYGTYPDCLPCAPGSTEPSCPCPPPYQGEYYPDCGSCPPGTTGTYPDCDCLPGSTAPQCQPCPAGTIGTPPNCRLPCESAGTCPEACEEPPCGVTQDITPIEPIGLPVFVEVPAPVPAIAPVIDTPPEVYCAEASAGVSLVAGRETIVANNRWQDREGDWQNRISLNDGRIELVLQNADTGKRFSWLSAERVSPNAWSHIAIAYKNAGDQGTDAALYIDGVRQRVALTGVDYLPAFAPAHDKNGSFVMGKSLHEEYDQRGYFNGRIDEIEYYGRALTEDEIKLLHTAGRIGACDAECQRIRRELRSKWPAELTPDDVIGDNPATLMNGATYADGFVQKAFSLDGLNDFIDLNNNIYNPFPAEGFTYATWVHPVRAGDFVTLTVGPVDEALKNEGYDIITSTKVSCASNLLDVTLNIPDNYKDIRAYLIGEDGTLELPSEDLVAPKCGQSWAQDIRRQQVALERPAVIGPEEIAAVEEIIRTIEQTDAERAVSTGKYRVELLSTKDAVTVHLSAPVFAVPRPAHPNVAILGTPLSVEVSPPFAGPVRITMPYAVPAFIDTGSVALYVRAGGQWRRLDSTYDVIQGVVWADVSDISLFLDADNTAVFAVMGVTCTSCASVTLDQVYNGGSRKAVFLVHGFTTDPKRWQSFVDDLSRTRSEWQVWVINYPLAMESDAIAAQLSALIEQRVADIDTASFVAHSMGGIIVQRALQHAENAGFAWPRKVADVIMAGQPGLGSPSADVYGRLYATLLNLKSAAAVWSQRSPLLTEAVAGTQVARSPEAEYFVIAGRQSYPFTYDLFKKSDAYLPNDGVISIFSARTVGGNEITDTCRHYFEVPRTHTDLLDDWLPRKVMQRILFRQDALGQPEKAIAGYNKFVHVVNDNCQSGTLVVLGKTQVEPATADPLNCKCGNGVCGEGENQVNCPQDCAIGYKYKYLCRILPWIIGPLLALLVLLTAVYVYGAEQRHERGKGAVWISSLAALTFLLLLFHYILCGFTMPLAVLVLVFVLALLGFTFAHLGRAQRGQNGHTPPPAHEPKPARVAPKPVREPPKPREAPKPAASLIEDKPLRVDDKNLKRLRELLEKARRG